MDLHAYLLGRISRLPPGDHPLGRINAFRRQFPRPHLVFACHAALPIALTPHLLNMLWVNFQRDQCNTPLKIPWVATADLLLSRLCQQVGGRLYQMHHGVRQELLAALYQDSCFGERRLFDLAVFVRAYVSPELEGNDPYWRPVAQAQDWNALAYLDPKQAATSLSKELSQSIDANDYAEQLRLASILETLADPLRDYNGLVEYARLRRSLVQGQAPSAQEAALAGQQIQTFAAPTADGKLTIPGLKDLPLPALQQGLPAEVAGAHQETLLIQARLALSQRNFALAKQLVMSAKELGPSSLEIENLQDAAEGLPSRLEYMARAQKEGDFSAYQLHLKEAKVLLAHLEPDPQAAQALLENLLGGPALTWEAFEQAATTPSPPRPQPVDLAALLEIADEHERAEALIELAPEIPQTLLGEAISIARLIRDERERVRAYTALIPHLQADQKDMVIRIALETSRKIQDERTRAEALVALGRYLPESKLDELLTEVLTIRDETILVPALSALLPGLPPLQRQMAKDTALHALKDIGDPRARAEALATLLDSHTGIEKELLEEETLPTLLDFPDVDDRLEAQTTLLPHLSEKTLTRLLPEMQSTIRKSQSGRPQVISLINLMPYLEPEQRRKVVDQAYKAALEIVNERARVYALIDLLPYLTEWQRAETIDWIRQAMQRVEDPRAQVEVIIGLLPYLPDQQREAASQEAMAAARKIPDEQESARLIAELLRYPSSALAEQAETPLQAAEEAPLPEFPLPAGDLEISLTRAPVEAKQINLVLNNEEYQVALKVAASNAQEPPLIRSSVADFERVRSLTPENIEHRYPQQLQDSLFADSTLRTLCQQALSAAQDRLLRVRLRIERDAARLHDLYWETLSGPGEQALFPPRRAIFSRFVPTDFEAQPPPYVSDFRALVVISNPSDLESYVFSALDSASEADLALRVLQGVSSVEVLASQPESAGQATPEGLQSALAKGADILYLVGHLVSVGDRSDFLLERSDGRYERIPAGDLVRLLMGQSPLISPRLVVLINPGSAGRDVELGSAAGFSVVLAESGVPAILYFQGRKSSSSQERFLTVFFTELRNHGQVDRAAAAARAAISTADDWWSPVLMTSLPDGALFQPAAGPQEAVVPSREDLAATWSQLVVPVSIAGDDRDAVSRLVELVQVGRKESTPFLKLAASGETPQIEVLAEVSSQDYRIPFVNTEYPAREVITPKGTVEDARRAYTLLSLIASRMNLLRLQNLATRLPADAMALELFIVNSQSGERSLLTASTHDRNLYWASYDPAQNPSGVPIQLRLVHTSRVPQPLFCAIYALEDDIDKSIQALFPSGVWLQPGLDAWTDAANPDLIFNLGMRPEPGDPGTRTTRTALKLMVATAEFDPSLLEQAGVDAPVTKAAIHQAVQRPLPPTPTEQEDWYTQTVWLEISVTEEPPQVADQQRPAEVAQEVQSEASKNGYVYFNGINGETGDYDLPPVSVSSLSERIHWTEPPDNLGQQPRQEQDE